MRDLFLPRPFKSHLKGSTYFPAGAKYANTYYYVPNLPNLAFTT